MKPLPKFIHWLNQHIPNSAKQLFRQLKLDRLLNKYQAELLFQQQLAKQLKQHNLKQLIQNYWTKYRHLKTINQLTKTNKNTTILDVGCGISSILYCLPGKLYGLDPLADQYQKLLPYPKRFNIKTKPPFQPTLTLILTPKPSSL